MIKYSVNVIAFNTTFNNISVVSWRSVLLYPEKITDMSQVIDNLYHTMLYRVHLAVIGIRTNNWLLRYLKIQLPYDHDHDGPHIKYISWQGKCELETLNVEWLLADTLIFSQK